MTAAERRKLTDVARGARPADLVIRGGTLLNVYTGELYPAHVAVQGERIAYVGRSGAQVLLDGPPPRAVPHGGRGAPLPAPGPRKGARAPPRRGGRRGHALARRVVRPPGPAPAPGARPRALAARRGPHGGGGRG